MEKERLKLRAEFELETGITWTNSQGEPDVDYVDWLEERVINPTWYSPDQVPPKGEWKGESIAVMNQSDEEIFYDLYDKEWYNYDNQGRIAHVEKWRYPEPKKTK